jgi:hypothetical protein
MASRNYIKHCALAFFLSNFISLSLNRFYSILNDDVVRFFIFLFLLPPWPRSSPPHKRIQFDLFFRILPLLYRLGNLQHWTPAAVVYMHGWVDFIPLPSASGLSSLAYKSRWRGHEREAHYQPSQHISFGLFFLLAVDDDFVRRPPFLVSFSTPTRDSYCTESFVLWFLEKWDGRTAMAGVIVSEPITYLRTTIDW